MNVEVQKEGIYIIVRDPTVIYRHKLSPREAWEMSRKLTQALFKYKELTGLNPLANVGEVEGEKNVD